MSPQESGANEPETEVTQAITSGGTIEALDIGPYHLLRPIGRGGMGEVWLAEQREPVRRRVAIKLIKAGMDTREVVARFESERQALALMDHPAIAKVFDAGTTPQGRPFFVMEYVVGIPITEYCDKHKMTTRQRLELFIQVCQGVQHAHQKAIIHRDLKPSNILVGEVDGKPMPRIIDFGVAKATTQQLTAETLYTHLGAIVGTPGYMSPEQADSTGVDVDTRTDVYSLGVVLYELLAGSLPLDFRNLSFEDVLRRLRDEDAPAPSTRLRTLGEQSGVTAQNRGSDRASLTRQLRGDLDCITLKALEKDRSRRYSMPSELAADIGRYLRNEPVMARPASAAYRTRKYIRRHRIGVAVAAAACVVVFSFAVAQALELQRIRSERDRATRERDRADRVTTFMTDMFQVSDPSVARGNSITAREILDKSANEIGSMLGSEPRVQADLLGAMARSYQGLGLYPRARELTEKALAIQRRALGPQDRKTLESMSFLGSTMMSAGNASQARKWLEDTLAIQQKVLGPDDPDTLTTRRYLSDVFFAESDFQGAERFARETLALERRVLGPESPNTLQTILRLSNALELQGHYAEAEKLQREVLEVDRRIHGAEHPATLFVTNQLAKVLIEEEKYPESESLLSQTLPVEQRVFGPQHPNTLDALGNFAYAHLKEGKYMEAEKLYREILDAKSRAYGPDNINLVSDMEELAIAYTREGRYEVAARIFQQAVGIAEKNNDAVVKVAWYNFACAAAIAGRREEAFRYLREAVDKGFVYPDAIRGDKDLASLHSDSRFAALIEEARQRAAVQKN
jgi:non-specific serine/threonine protein kinase/serine/threonine-protein kinase